MSMSLYANNATSPTVANCSFTGCSKAYGDSGEQITCDTSTCCTTGWMITPLARLFNMVSGTTMVSMRSVSTAAKPIQLSLIRSFQP